MLAVRQYDKWEQTVHGTAYTLNLMSNDDLSGCYNLYVSTHICMYIYTGAYTFSTKSREISLSSPPLKQLCLCYIFNNLHVRHALVMEKYV